ncbi:MAG: class I SAM-dependent methyltransferase, partial [Flavisolibacter sp.]|nr:class I SAM-dependent methyltransferase [Flavisolibacter sp.]
STVWSNYYEEAGQRGDYLAVKKQIISDWLSRLNIKTVFDAGANEGEFSELAAGFATYVISTDSDHSAISKLYQKVLQKKSSNIFPFVLDLANPSPAVGVNNKERPSFLERIKVDLTLALALIHHLALGRNIPFEKIAEMFSCAGKYLVIEFVPGEDEMVRLMTSHKKELLPAYTEENFLTAFQKFFFIHHKQEVSASGRTLYLMQKHNE